MELLFHRNENANNEMVSKILLGLAAFILVIWLFCLLGIFDFNVKAATLFSGISVVALGIPIILIYIFHMNQSFMKYILISILSLIIGLCYCVFTFQMMIMFLIPSLVSMMYMNKKLLYFSGIFNIFVVTGVHIETHFYVLQPWLEPFTSMKDIIRFGVVPRLMQLGLCFCLLVIIMNRMLSYMEQLNKINLGRQPDSSSDQQAFHACLEKLTEREREVFLQMLLGKTNIQIAETLCLSIGTVKNYVSSIYDKTGMRERNYLILKFGHLAINYDQSNYRL